MVWLPYIFPAKIRGAGAPQTFIRQHLDTSLFLVKSTSSHSAKFWKYVWQSPSIPNIIFFTWILMHQRALTRENLLKRGFFGPFRCCFCKQAAETFKHIFVGCEFTQKAWAFLLTGLSVSTPSNNEPVNLFANWQNINILEFLLQVMTSGKFGKQSQNSFGGKFGSLEMT